MPRTSKYSIEDRTVELLKKVQEYERRRFSPKGN